MPPTTLPQSLQHVLERYGRWLVPVALFLSFIPLALKYWYETERILGLIPGSGGIDLGFFVRWTHSWFGGSNIYILGDTPQGYPPASMVLLYPFTGWLPMEGARWLWAFTTILSFGIVAYIAIRATGAKTLPQRVGIIFLFLYINGTSVTYGNGQATLHILACVLAAILLLHTRPVSWQSDLIAAVLLIWALVKPNLSAPFLWLVLIYPRSFRLRPLVLIVVGYLAFSLYAAALVSTPLPRLWQQFLANRLQSADISIDPNIHYLLGNWGLDQLLLPASAVIGLALGIWIYRHRQADIWLLLGVTTLAMRFWGFHWVYDSAFLIVPEVVLVRILKRESAQSQFYLIAALLLGLNILVMLPPGNFGGQSLFIQNALAISQGIVWLVTLGMFLVYSNQPPHSAKDFVVQLA